MAEVKASNTRVRQAGAQCLITKGLESIGRSARAIIPSINFELLCQNMCTFARFWASSALVTLHER